MNHHVARLLTLPLLACLLTACPGGGGGGTPDCLVFTPVHATSGGNVDVGAMIEGEVLEGVIEVETTAIEGAPSAGVFIDVQSNCDDPDCTPTFDCSPGTLDPVGTTVLCDVADEIEGDSCAWSCQLRLTATVLDTDVCRDVASLSTVVGTHELALGR